MKKLIVDDDALKKKIHSLTGLPRENDTVHVTCQQGHVEDCRVRDLQKNAGQHLSTRTPGSPHAHLQATVTLIWKHRERALGVITGQADLAHVGRCYAFLRFWSQQPSLGHSKWSSRSPVYFLGKLQPSCINAKQAQLKAEKAPQVFGWPGGLQERSSFQERSLNTGDEASDEPLAASAGTQIHPL